MGRKRKTGARYYRTVKAIDTDAFKELRKACGFNQVQLTEKAGVYAGAVQRIEQGQNISVLHAESIAAVLGRPMPELFRPPTAAATPPQDGAIAVPSAPARNRTTPPVALASDDRWAAEKTYFRYRDEPCPRIDSPEAVRHLEERYRCTALSLGTTLIPVTVLWKNSRRIIHPDKILGTFDGTPPAPLSQSLIFSPAEYPAARAFIKREYECGRIKYEGCDYRMTRIVRSGQVPRISGAFGLYYDNILTQYAIEWELRKALIEMGPSGIEKLVTPGTLPLREAIEQGGDPLWSGHDRCAALSVSTLLVFKRRTAGFSCLVRRRSMEVGVSRGVLHVVPAAMFEASNTSDRWSVELNVWRELLEELYDEEDMLGSQFAEILDYVRGREPVKLLRRLMQHGGAEFSVTGLVCDLLYIRPEICTILYVNDPAFVESRKMRVSWEYEPEERTGMFAVPWNRIDDVIEHDVPKYGIGPGAAACIALGREWMKNRHRM